MCYICIIYWGNALIRDVYDDDLGRVNTIKAFGFTNQYVDTPADIDLG